MRINTPFSCVGWGLSAAALRFVVTALLLVSLPAACDGAFLGAKTTTTPTTSGRGGAAIRGPRPSSSGLVCRTATATLALSALPGGVLPVILPAHSSVVLPWTAASSPSATEPQHLGLIPQQPFGMLLLASETAVDSWVGGLTTLAYVALGLLVALFALAFATTNWLLPAAAQQLEENCRRDCPDLWNEFQAKLGPGEILAQRPDLVQELGNEYNRRFLRELEARQQELASPPRSNGGDNPGTGRSTTKVSDSAIDVEVKQVDSE